ncbi:hypothetical protein [Pseudodesulfovibrio pelocollis]|uniref:hypothetical protein n=1 Tax=Pseudodesulfovibrio pelocollis TaxID=3051432 RepID=UPI00255AD3EF|nr:hypothetical protein [Pseudodesulfovibrio sp. SB368]
MNGATVTMLAGHLGLSAAQTSRHCNAAEVPTAVLAGMTSYATPTGKHIPREFLPLGRDKSPGPAKGWIERRLEAARQGAAAANAATNGV